MKSQNAIATLGNIASCTGENVLVPLDVVDFNDVGAMTMYIGYDTNVAEFVSIQNINPGVPSSISYNATNGQINIAYSSPTGFYISGEKLFDLSFTFLGDSTALPFNPGTEIANSNAEVIPLDTYSGSLHNSIRITDQPDTTQSYPDNDVIFTISSQGNTNYQWQENNGSGWNNLQNNTTYSGVSTDTLTIYDVPLTFNGFTYRCLLTEDNCTVISDTALLEVAVAFPVATLGQVNSCPDISILEPVLVGDFYDVIDFTFNISFDPLYLTFLDLENIHPVLSPGDINISPMTDPPGISLHWENSNPVSISNGKLFDINFLYAYSDQFLAFEEGTIVLNSFFNPVNITLNNGVVNQNITPQITSQPVNETVIENESAQFSVTAANASGYYWQLSTNGGNSWEDLNETPPYYNVHTEILTVDPAIYSMDEYLFRCRIESNYCAVISDYARLDVDTLTNISVPENESGFMIYPVPFKNVVHLSAQVTCNIKRIYITDASGEMQLVFNYGQNINEGGIDLDLSGLQPGLFFVGIMGSEQGKAMHEKLKIIKTE
jgi:hypothetical protein